MSKKNQTKSNEDIELDNDDLKIEHEDIVLEDTITIEDSAKIDEPEIDVNAELKDKLLRTLAEFDNFRKRTSKEKASMYDDGVKDTIEKLLPTIDNFERALTSSDTKDSSLYANNAKRNWCRRNRLCWKRI
jgi:molecular chaperone GrpE